jgi:hypothetical protein
LGNRLRAWIRGRSKGPDDHIKEDNGQGSNLAKLLVRSLVPAPSSVLMVSAPGLLLSASLYSLLIGFGIYLGFMWTRALDDSAGPDDNRDVFIIYLVSLFFCYGLYSTSDAAHDRRATDTVGGTIQDSLTKLQSRLDMSERRRKERRKETEETRQLLLEQVFLSRQILEQLKETHALRELVNIDPHEEDGRRRTPVP